MQWRHIVGALALAVIAFLAVTLGVSGFASLRRHEAAEELRRELAKEPQLQFPSAVSAPATAQPAEEAPPELATAETEGQQAEADAARAETPAPASADAAAPAKPSASSSLRQRDAVDEELLDGVAAPGARASVPVVVSPEPPKTPLAAPVRVQVKPTSSSEIVVEWAPPPGGGLDLIYELRRGDQIVSRGPARKGAEASLRPGQKYCYTVQAFDGWGRQSPPAGPVCAADAGPPTAPPRVDAVAASDTQIDLRWAASSDDTGVAAYEVQRVDGESALVIATQHSAQGLKPARSYCFTVTAMDLAGNRSPAAGPACATTPDLKPPAPPAHVAISLRPPSSMVVAWDDSTDDVGVTGYEVFRDGKLIATAGGTSLTETGLKVAVRYCFTVRAFDAAGNRSSPGGPACGVLPDVDPPSVPGELIAAGNSASRVEIGWQPSTDNVAVTGYEVLRYEKLISTTHGWRASESALLPDTEYCYRVRALDRAGNRSGEAGPVCARTAAAGSLSAPVGLRATSISAKGVSLVWEASEGKDVVYRIYGRSKRKGARPAIVGVTSSIAFTDEGVPTGVPRCYAIVAVDGAARESPRSLETCAVASEPASVASTP